MEVIRETNAAQPVEDRLEGVFLQAVNLCDQLNQSRSQLLQERSEVVKLIGDLLAQAKMICEYESKLKASIDHYVASALERTLDEVRDSIAQEASRAIEEVKDNMNRLSDQVGELISRFDFERQKTKFNFYLFNFFISVCISAAIVFYLTYKI